MAGKDDIPAADVSSGADPRGALAAHRGCLFKQGEFWRITYDGTSFGLRHSKGLAYLAQLLRSPGTEFQALDLAGGSAGAAADWLDGSAKAQSSLPHGDSALAMAGIHIGGFGDAGEMLDEQAKAQ